MNAISKIEKDLADAQTLLKEYNSNHNELEDLKKEIEAKVTPLQDALDRNNKTFVGIPYDRLSRVEIVELIEKVNKEQNDKVIKLHSFIEKTNNYAHILTQIVNNLMSFYNTSYEDLKQCADTLEEISGLVDKNIDNTGQMSGQVNSLIKGQLKRIYHENKQNSYIKKLYRHISLLWVLTLINIFILAYILLSHTL